MRYIFLITAPASASISTLPLHDALPILDDVGVGVTDVLDIEFQLAPLLGQVIGQEHVGCSGDLVNQLLAFSAGDIEDRKSTRLNSSHVAISYAVFCLKKKNTKK